MAIPTKKISELTVLSSVQATDKVPIGRPSSSSGNSITLATLAAFVENITKSNAASSSNDSPSPNALATMAAVIEKKTVTIDTWPENPDKAVTYLAAAGTYEAIGDNGEDIEVPTGCQATLNWDAETDCWIMGTPIPVGTTGSGSGGSITPAQTIDTSSTTDVPSSKAVGDYVDMKINDSLTLEDSDVFGSLAKKFDAGNSLLVELASFRQLAHLLSSGLSYTNNGKGLIKTTGNESNMNGRLFKMLPVDNRYPLYIYCGAPTSGYCSAVFYKNDGNKIDDGAIVTETTGFITKSSSWLATHNVAFVSFCMSETEYQKNEWFMINSTLYSLAIGKFTIPQIMASGFSYDTTTNTMHIGTLYYFYENVRKKFIINNSFVFSNLIRSVVLNTKTGEITTPQLGAFSNNFSLNKEDIVLLSYSDSGEILGGALYNYYLNAVKKDIVDTYTLPYESVGQLNAVKKAYQMAALTWKPVSETASSHIPNNSGSVFTTASEKKGVPYSSCKEFYGYVPQCVSYHTFLSAVRNKHSILYTEDINESPSRTAYGRTYHGNNCHTYYGSVCSSLVSHAIGLKVILGTSDFEKAIPNIKPIAQQNADFVKQGDMLLNDGHIALVTNVIKNVDGTTKRVEITHSAGNQVLTVDGSAYNFNILLKEYRELHSNLPSYSLTLGGLDSDPYTIIRYDKIYNNDVYEADSEVPILDEQGVTVDALPVLPILGDKCNFVISGSSRDLPIKLLISKPSSDYTTLEIFKNDTSEPITIALTTGMTSLVIDSSVDSSLVAYGDYKARLVGDSEDVTPTDYCFWKVVEIDVDVTPISQPTESTDATRPTIAFSSKGAVPYAFSRNSRSGGVSPWRKEEGDGYNQSVSLLSQSDYSPDEDTDTYSGSISPYHWPKKDNGEYYALSEISGFARIMFKNDYGIVINPIDDEYKLFVES